MDNLIKTLIAWQAKTTNTPLTESRMNLLEFVYQYYQKYHVGPLFQNIRKHTGLSKKDIESLFPNGLASVYNWTGIPIHSIEKICKPVSTIRVDDYREIYLDYNSTTPVRKEVLDSILDYYSNITVQGNPSSGTSSGKLAYNIMESARKKIANCLDVKPSEIIFTGSGSEANNLAIKGLAFEYSRKGFNGHIITSCIEHKSVLKTIQNLEEYGFEITYLPVDSQGLVNPDDLKKNIRKNTIFVSMMTANNEIGTIQPVAEFGRICKESNIPFMSDAIQAFTKIPLKPKEFNISLLSLSGHKIYAPKGIGCLFVDEELNLTPLIDGGAQEYGLRAGTENVVSIIALAKAAGLAISEMPTETKRLENLKNYFLEKLKIYTPDIVVNGCLDKRLPNNLNIGFKGVDGNALLLSLNQTGIYASTGSACNSGGTEVSHVIKAIGLNTEEYATIRFSFGRYTTKDDLDYTIKYVQKILEDLKK